MKVKIEKVGRLGRGTVSALSVLSSGFACHHALLLGGVRGGGDQVDVAGTPRGRRDQSHTCDAGQRGRVERGGWPGGACKVSRFGQQ